ncbi:MAG TPA: FAD-dependent oxidoreductase, partial [Actinopolymorphaceae bacterium]
SGCSWGGENARMFTLTEADDYHDHVPGTSHAHRVFEQPPSRSGWDIRRRRDLPADHAWVQEFKRVPPWLARGYNHDIFGLNRRSGELWDDWLRSDPEFFASAHLRQDVLRLYEDPGHFEEALVRQHQVGATLAHYRPEQIRERWPTLAEAAPDAFAGGILVRGFTVNVHDFLRRLVEDLEASGSHVRFDVRVTAVRRDGRDRVSGVQTTDGPYAARHYLISPGVYGNDLLEGTLSDAQIHGVLGCWATVPDLGPSLENSLKVGRRGHIVEDANVTVAKDREGRPILIVGSGYGWTGSDPTNIEQSELDALHRGVADTIRRLFPRAYEAVGGEPGLRASQTFCVRPWTASNLGLFETVPAGSGVVVIADGHNTGGFAQAPVIAEAVLAAVQGKHHPMHALYHPGRTDLALGRRVDVGQGVP